MTLCIGCHARGAALQRQVVRARAAYAVILVLLFFIAAGVSYSLHVLWQFDRTLTRWVFWVCLAASVVASAWLSLLLLALRV